MRGYIVDRGRDVDVAVMSGFCLEEEASPRVLESLDALKEERRSARTNKGREIERSRLSLGCKQCEAGALG